VELYFIQGQLTRHIKIGQSKCVYSRFKTLQASSPDKLKLLGVISTNTPFLTEGLYHDHFRSDRVHGEWYKESQELLDRVAQKAHLHATCEFCGALTEEDYATSEPDALDCVDFMKENHKWLVDTGPEENA
jgi:pyruvate carboxylase